MRRWTRSSYALNGSLHSTVRCAWSLSFRWTQSTVKSRRRSWACRMNSPRRRARVVCGGGVLAPENFSPQAGRGGLWRGLLRREDLQVGGDPVDRAPPLHQLVEAAPPAQVVVRQIQ